MIDLKGGKKEQLVRKWFNEVHEGIVPKGKVLDLFQEFNLEHTDEVAYGSFNAVVKKIQEEGHGAEGGSDTPVHTVVNPVIIKVEDMEFPDFALYKSGKKIDELFSDHEEGGGTYGGTVNIVIGESGVGKSTVMLDHLSAITDLNPGADVLYISSEMTRNDIGFYYKKTPSIGKVPTLLLMDYVQSGQLAKVLEKAFNDGHQMILLDSYQDVLVKLKEVHNWRTTYAESWLTNMMITAAEKKGCAVFAIQHMTKGGTYVGSTYLKHATTAMLEMRFDMSGKRYVEFSKNRRGGSGVNKRLYYSLDKTGSVVYDTARFKETEEIKEIENTEVIRKDDLSKKFEEVFLGGRKSVDEPVPVSSDIDINIVAPEV
jgi:predicted ATP-dependent serine protease